MLDGVRGRFVRGVVAEADADRLVVGALFGTHEGGQHLPVGIGRLAAEREGARVSRRASTGLSSAAYRVSLASSSRNNTIPMTVPNVP